MNKKKNNKQYRNRNDLGEKQARNTNKTNAHVTRFKSTHYGNSVYDSLIIHFIVSHHFILSIASDCIIAFLFLDISQHKAEI